VTSTTSTFVRAIAALISAGLMLAAPASHAQEADQPATQGKTFGPRSKPAAQQPPPAEVVATHGAWKITCETAAEGKKACGMVQTARSETAPNVALTLIVLRAKQGDKNLTLMRIMAPIGVYLPTGIAVEIDGVALERRINFERCGPRAPVCLAIANPEPATLEKFKKGNSANFFIYETLGRGLPIKVSLEGFGKALAELDKF
jgi:invasion protein IalB